MSQHKVRTYFDHSHRSGSPKNKKYFYITINPHQGGLESRDFCNIITRMIEKYADKNGIPYEIIESTDFTTVLRLESSISKFKGLSGLHKLVRISPFGKGDKTHTSLCKVAVNAPKEKFTVEIRESDITMDFFKATGPGGQHRNKTMSAVRLVHKPTKITVTSSASRSQHDNRRYAYEQLQCKLEEVWDNEQKDQMVASRNQEKQHSEVVFSYYFNHQFVINEKSGQKASQLKQILNGNLDLII